MGHFHQDCPKKKRNVAAVVHQDQVDEYQTVSVDFFNLDRRTDVIKVFSFFDTGSPISCVKRSIIPFSFGIKPQKTKFRGIGNKAIISLGLIKCEIYFKKHRIVHTFLVLPDEEDVVPMLIGRDLMFKLNVKLTQSIYIYKKTELNEINMQNINQKPPNKIISPLMYFKLFRIKLSQFQLDKNYRIIL